MSKALHVMRVGALSAVVIAALAGCGNSTSGNNNSASNSGGSGSGNSSASNTSTSNTASSGTQTSSDSNQPITLTVGGWPAKTDPNYSQYEKWKTEFEQKYPNITIKESPLNYWTGGSNGASFYTAAAANQLPNINTAPFTEFSRVINNGYAADIQSELKDAGWLQYLNPQVKPDVTKNGDVYGIPTAVQPMGLWINVTVFKKAGLVDANGLPKFPKTWAEVEQDAKTIHDKTGLVGWEMPSEQNSGGWYFLQLAYNFGENFEQKDSNGKWQATFNDAPAVQALTWLKNVKWKDNAVQPQSLLTISQAWQAFGTNQAGMMFGSPDWTNILVQNYKANMKNFGVALMPAGPSGSPVDETGGTWTFFSAQSTPAQVKAGLEWMQMTGTTPLFSQSALDGFTQLIQNNVKKGYPVGPGDPSPWTSDAPMTQKEQAVVQKNINVDMKLYQDWTDNATKYMKPEPPIDTQQMYATLDKVVQQVLTNKNADPQTILDKAAKDFQTNYLDKYNAAH